MGKIYEKSTVTQDLTVGALSFTITPSEVGPSKVLQVTIASTVAITEDVTISVVDAEGTAYDYVVKADTMTASKYYYTSDVPYLDIGDTLKVQVSDNNSLGIISITILIETY